MNVNNLQVKNRASNMFGSAAKKALLSLLLVVVCTLAQADSDANTSGHRDVKMPPHAMSMDDVERLFSKPISRLPAIGEPPISRWVYDQYTVYFEGRTVIHSVMHHPEKK